MSRVDLRFTSNPFMIKDMNRRGFTLIELLMVLVIMGILLGLGVVNLRGSQISSRDNERISDIDSIALHLETYYNSGTDGSTTIGTYPSTDLAASVNNITTYLRDMDIKSATAPTVTTTNSDGSSLIAATDGTILTSASPHPTINEYVYQPLKSDGTLCSLTTSECVKFNLYYRLESANITTDCPSPGYVCKVTSKNQ